MKNSFSVDFKMVVRALKITRQIEPSLLALKILNTFFKALSPFVTLYLSALLLDELAVARRTNVMILFAAMIVLTDFVFAGISQLLTAVISQREFAFSKKYDMLLGERILDFDYERIEDSKTHMLLEKIQAGRNLHNYGLTKIPETIPTFFYHIFRILFSIALSWTLFAGSSRHFNDLPGFLSSIYFGFVILIFAVISAAVSMHATNALSLKIKDAMAGFTYLNRSFDYYLRQYMDGYKAGKDIRLYRQHTLINRELGTLAADACEGTRKRCRIDSHYSNICQIFSQILSFLVYVFVAMKAYLGQVGIGNILKYVSCFSELINGATEAAHMITILRANNTWLIHFFEYMDIPDKMTSGTATVGDEIHSIEFRHVSFRYPGCEQYALKDISLTLRPKEKLAVVGMNGSGKSTFIKLLCRLYDPEEGQILLNGTDIREYDYSQYLSVMSVVFQNYRLFSTSLGENLSCRNDWDDQRAERVLTGVGLKERFPDRNIIINKDFDTQGVELSGGEAQRVAMARAIYKGAPIIILDEPTAALDPIAESQIYEQFSNIVAGKTAVFISHRLSSCCFCDRIAVFENGRLIQEGTHTQLLGQTDGTYSKLWHAQAKYYLPEEAELQ